MRCPDLGGLVGDNVSDGVRRGFERGDDLVQVSEHVPVHLGQPLLAAGLGGGDDLGGATS